MEYMCVYECEYMRICEREMVCVCVCVVIISKFNFINLDLLVIRL